MVTQAKKKNTKTSTKDKSNLSAKFSDIAKDVALKSGHPTTFVCAFAIIVLWAVTGPVFKFNDTWQLVINTSTTIITFLMVFLIQNTQNRDSEALQVKLDEIIRALEGADNNMINLEDASPKELDEAKNRYTNLAKAAKDAIDERKAS